MSVIVRGVPRSVTLTSVRLGSLGNQRVERGCIAEERTVYNTSEWNGEPERCCSPSLYTIREFPRPGLPMGLTHDPSMNLTLRSHKNQ